MFQVGDYVMGKDRSYQRSVYRVHEIVNSDLFHLQFICLGGRTSDTLELSEDRKQDQFEVITAKQVHSELGYGHKASLIKLLIKMNVRKSYLVLR